MKDDMFHKDLFRYYGTGRETFLQRLLRPKELQFLCFSANIPMLRAL